MTSDLEQRNRQTKYMPFAFTEQGVAMLASVLKSDIAIAANIAILRAFVHIREYPIIYINANFRSERAQNPSRFITATE